jgi:hypothetical protein
MSVTIWRILRVGAGVVLVGVLLVTMGVGVLLGIMYLLSA